MKNFLLPAFCFLMIFTTVSYGQEQGQPGKRNSQSDLQNEVFAGYGAGSIYYFTGRISHSSGYPAPYDDYYYNSYYHGSTYTTPSSPGTFYFGYSRALNQVISLGFMFGYQHFNYTGDYEYSYDYDSISTSKLTNDDHLVTGIARVTFSYVNKPVVRIYSGIAMGFTVNFGSATLDGVHFSDRKLFPAGQITFMGIRYGRALGGFFEFGFGSLGIVNAGISYRFHD